jgi:hypothetical protein
VPGSVRRHFRVLAAAMLGYSNYETFAWDEMGGYLAGMMIFSVSAAGRNDQKVPPGFVRLDADARQRAPFSATEKPGIS